MKAYYLVLSMLTLLAAACLPQPAQPTDAATENPLVSQGQQLYKQYCAACHAIEGDTVIVGPSLDGVATWGADQVPGMGAYEYIQQSITNPGVYLVEGYKNLMPASFNESMDGEQLNALMAYMMTLE